MEVGDKIHVMNVYSDESYESEIVAVKKEVVITCTNPPKGSSFWSLGYNLQVQRIKRVVEWFCEPLTDANDGENKKGLTKEQLSTFNEVLALTRDIVGFHVRFSQYGSDFIGEIISFDKEKGAVVMGLWRNFEGHPSLLAVVPIEWCINFDWKQKKFSLRENVIVSMNKIEKYATEIFG